MRRELEALLFASDQPLSVARIKPFFPKLDAKAIRQALKELGEQYDRDQHAFTIVEFGGGYSISTRPEFAPFVRKLFRGRRKVRLSKPALECLAIIAYKQPVTRLEIEDIRGVSVQGVLGTLLERDLVQIMGRAQSLGSPLLYGSTKGFLDYMGLTHLRELPQLSELEDILAQKEELKQLAGRYDEDISDEDFERVANPQSAEPEEESAGEAEAPAPTEHDETGPDDAAAAESISG